MSELYRDKEDYPARVLEYRQKIKLLELVMRILLFVLLLSIAGVCVMFSSSLGNIESVYTIGLILFFIFIIGVPYFIFVKPSADMKIQVYEDRLILKSEDGKKILKIEEMINIKAYGLEKNSVAGFEIEMKNRKRYKFSILLERCDYILDAIYESNNKVMQLADYRELREKLILSDHSVGRFCALFSSGSMFTYYFLFHFIGLPTYLGWLMYREFAKEVIFYRPYDFIFSSLGVMMISCFISFALVYILTEIKLNGKTKQKLRRSPNFKARDMEYESQSFLLGIPVQLALVLFLFYKIYDYRLGLKGRAFVEPKTAYHLKRSGVEFDMRYNCMTCKYQLIKGDKVITTDGAVGTVIGFSSASGQIDRKIASQVSSGSVQLQSIDKKKRSLIPLYQIRGKVLE